MSPSQVKNSRIQSSQIDLVIATDASGSMALPFHEDRPNRMTEPIGSVPSKMEWLSDALSKVISQLGEDDRLGIVCYNTDARTIHRIRDARSYEGDELRTSLMECEVAGGTNLCDGIEKCVELFGRESDATRSKRILFVSDSLPSAPPEQSPFVNRLREMATEGVKISFVGLDASPSREFERSLSGIEGITQYYINSSSESIRI